MRRYIHYGYVLMLLCIGPIGLQAQSSLGANVILYVGERASEEDNTRTVYMLDVENQSDAIAIGHTNKFGSDVGWSPSGRYVYIINYDDEGNRILSLYDTETEFTEVISEALHDRECIAPVYWSTDDEFLAYGYLDGEQAYVALHDLSDGTETTLGEIDRRLGGSYTRLWSPQGRYLLLSTLDTDDVLLVDTDADGEITTLPLDITQRFEWSGDDRYLMFIQHEPENGIISVYDTVTGEITTTSGNVIGEFSPDNQYALYVDRDYNGTEHLIYMLDLNARNEVQITDRASAFYALWWSSDSASVAYITREDAATTENPYAYTHSLQLYDIAAGASEALLTDSPLIRHVLWSSMPEYVAVIYVPTGHKMEPGKTILYNLETETSTEFDFAIPNLAYAEEVQWTADGRYLSIVSADMYDVTIYDVSNDELLYMNEWVDESARFVSPTWSVDSRYMLFTGTEHGTSNNLYMYDVIDREAKYVISTDEYSEFIGWRGADENESLIYCGMG